MSWRGLLVAVALALVAVACSDSTQESPATAPPTTVATTTPASTTTVAPTPEEARIAEIEAIFRDLEYRRLDALYRNDEEAFRALFANEAYLDQSLGALELGLPFIKAPSSADVSFSSFTVVVDRPDCLAAELQVVAPAVIEGVSDLAIAVLTPSAPDDWGLAFVGSGWLCDGDHPLEG